MKTQSGMKYTPIGMINKIFKTGAHTYMLGVMPWLINIKLFIIENVLDNVT